ncbi:MAG: hypothetical protein NC898_03655 [Candidatus Omnitrophica bacterium]|nr:hypothetical protein [Candidatus Omnitrophota bacterium]
MREYDTTGKIISVSLATLDLQSGFFGERLKIEKASSNEYILYNPLYYDTPVLTSFLKYFGYDLNNLKPGETIKIPHPLEELKKHGSSVTQIELFSQLESSWKIIQQALETELKQLGIKYTITPKGIEITLPTQRNPYKRLQISTNTSTHGPYLQIEEKDPVSQARLNTTILIYNNSQIPREDKILDELLDWVISENIFAGRSVTVPNGDMKYKLVYDHLLRLRKTTVYQNTNATEFYYPLPSEGNGTSLSHIVFNNISKTLDSKRIENDLEKPPQPALKYQQAQNPPYVVREYPSSEFITSPLTNEQILSSISTTLDNIKKELSISNYEGLLTHEYRIEFIDSQSAMDFFAIPAGKFLVVILSGGISVLNNDGSYRHLFTIGKRDPSDQSSLIQYTTDEGVVVSLVTNRDIIGENIWNLKGNGNGNGNGNNITITARYVTPYPKEGGYFSTFQHPSKEEMIAQAKSNMVDNFFNARQRFIQYATVLKVSGQFEQKRTEYTSSPPDLLKAQLSWAPSSPLSTYGSFIFFQPVLATIAGWFGNFNDAVISISQKLSGEDKSGAPIVIEFQNLFLTDSIVKYDLFTGAGKLDWGEKKIDFVTRFGGQYELEEKLKFKNWVKSMLASIVSDNTKLEDISEAAWGLYVVGNPTKEVFINALKNSSRYPQLKYLVFPSPADNWHPREGQIQIEINRLYITWAHVIMGIMLAAYFLPYIPGVAALASSTALAQRAISAINTLKGILTTVPGGGLFTYLAQSFARAIPTTFLFNVTVNPMILSGQTGNIDWVVYWNDLGNQFFSNFIYTWLFGIGLTPWQLGMETGLPTLIRGLLGKGAIGKVIGGALTYGDYLSRWFIGPKGMSFKNWRWYLYNYLVEGVMEEGLLPLAIELKYQKAVPKLIPPGMPQLLQKYSLLNLQNTETSGSLSEIFDPIESPLGLIFAPEILEVFFRNKRNLWDALKDALFFKNPML